jgi:serine/threonine-protein kinase
VRLGIFYVNHGKYQDATGPFTRVIELVPDNPAGYTDLGSTYHLQGREAEAEEKLKKSIQVRPTPLAYSNLATVYFFQRRYADAIPIFRELTEKGTKDYEIWGNLGDAYRWTPGNADKSALVYHRALELAEQRVAVNPRDARALIHIALYRAKTGQNAQTVRDLETALANASDDKSILFNAAIVCELTGNRARALGYLGKAISGGYSLNEIAAEPELGKLREDSSYKTLVSHNNGR